MQIADAQRDVREVYRSGFPGQLLAGLLWLAAAAAATAGSNRLAILILIVGGFALVPALYLLLRAQGRRVTLHPGNPFDALGRQSAFIVPLSIPLILAATAHRTEWFFPAFMVVVGTHYLPFVTLYGMRAFYLLGGGMIGAAIVIGWLGIGGMSLGAWLTSAMLLGFAAWAWRLPATE